MNELKSLSLVKVIATVGMYGSWWGKKKKKKVCVWGCEGLICEIRLKLENKKIRDSEVSHAIEE